MAFSVISTMEGSRVWFLNTSNLMSFGSNSPVRDNDFRKLVIRPAGHNQVEC